MPAFNIYLWLITTASAGNSLKVGLYNLDANTEISSWNIFRKNYAFLLYSFCKKIANESLEEIRKRRIHKGEAHRFYPLPPEVMLLT